MEQINLFRWLLSEMFGLS